MSELIVSLHNGCINKTNPDKVATGWRNEEVDLNDLISWVQQGYGWCGTHFHEGRRLKENATHSNLVVFDIDGHIRLEDWWAHPKVKEWCALSYTTASHSEASPRFRALFCLKQATADSAKHAAVYDAIASQVLPDLEPKYLTDAPFDHGGRQNSKLWYGNTAAQFQTNDACQGVPAWFVEAATPVEKGPSGPITPASDHDIAVAIAGLSQLRPSEDGEYQEVYWRVTKGCALIGGDQIHDAWLSWVDRGHHSSKPVNRNASVKWNGVQADGSVAYLFAVFNDLMPGWRDQLPNPFKPGFTTSVGYDEFEPPPNFDAGRSQGPSARQNSTPEWVPDLGYREPVQQSVSSSSFIEPRPAWAGPEKIYPVVTSPVLTQLAQATLQWLDTQPPVPVKDRRR